METSFFQTLSTLTSELGQWTVTSLRVIGIVVVAWVLTSVLQRLIRGFRVRIASRLDDRESVKRAETLGRVFRYLAAVVVWLIAVMLVLSEIGISVAPILGAAGVVGLAVGFGAQSLVKDYFTGFFLLLENQIRQGDVVQVDGHTGTVEGGPPAHERHDPKKRPRSHRRSHRCLPDTRRRREGTGLRQADRRLGSPCRSAVGGSIPTGSPRCRRVAGRGGRRFGRFPLALPDPRADRASRYLAGSWRRDLGAAQGGVPGQAALMAAAPRSVSPSGPVRSGVSGPFRLYLPRCRIVPASLPARPGGDL